jgi:hypothetical protein
MSGDDPPDRRIDVTQKYISMTIDRRFAAR